MNRQEGQTIIETIAAIFILLTSITAGLALTIYVFSNTNRGFNQLVATNLAREGVDVVRNMRDTNWLESDKKAGEPFGAGTPWDLQNCTIGSVTFKCFPKAWDGVAGGGYHNYSLNTPGSYRLEFDYSGNTWNLNPSSSGYELYLQGNGSYSHNINGSPVYYRKIVLNHNTAAPYSTVAGSLSELTVTSIVGWVGRGCTQMTGSPLDPSTTNCSVAITERLTNWKDYK